jgi:hypothetical protein
VIHAFARIYSGAQPCAPLCIYGLSAAKVLATLPSRRDNLAKQLIKSWCVIRKACPALDAGWLPFPKKIMPQTMRVGASMKFGIFYEYQLPRPWNEGDEARLFQEVADAAKVTLSDPLRHNPQSLRQISN